MVRLSEETLKLIEEFAKTKRELIDFEDEISKHEMKISKMLEQQQEKFTFERANELNALTLSVEQARESLRKRKEDTSKLMTGSVIKTKISNDADRLLKEDKDLVELEEGVLNKVEEILHGIEEYRTLFKFKRNNVKEAILKLSSENLTALTLDLNYRSEHAPFNNLLLERAIKNYKAPATNNR